VKLGAYLAALICTAGTYRSYVLVAKPLIHIEPAVPELTSQGLTDSAMFSELSLTLNDPSSAAFGDRKLSAVRALWHKPSTTIL